MIFSLGRGGQGPSPVRLVIFALTIFFAAFAHLHQDLAATAVSNVFQARDLDRAAALVSGKLILHGPEMLGGGALPGPFYYLLLAVPALTDSPWATSFSENIAFGAAGVTVLSAWAVRVCGPLAGLFVAVALMLSGHLAGELNPNWNASFAVFFQTISMILLLECAVAPDRKSAQRLALALGTSIGVSIQIHMTGLIPAGAYLLMATRRLGSKGHSLPLMPLIGGLLIPLIPGSAGLVRSIPSLLSFKDRVMDSMTAPIDLGTWIEYQFLRSPAIIVALAVILGLRTKRHFSDPRLAGLGWLAFTGLLIQLPWLQSAQLDRYSGIFQQTLAFGIAILCAQSLRRPGMAVLGAALVVALQLSFWPQNYQFLIPGRKIWYQAPLISRDESLAIGRFIVARTGWTFDEARVRLFTLGLHHHSDLSHGYQDAWKAWKLRGGTLGADPKPAGYLLSVNTRPGQKPDPVLSSEDLPKVLADLSSSRSLQLEPAIRISRRVRLIPYLNTASFPFPEGLHNIRSPELASGSGGTLLWDRCEGAEPSCPVFLKFEESPSGPEHRRVALTLSGRSLSRNSRWETPGWIERYERPFIRVSCDGRTRELVLAESLGSHFSAHLLDAVILAPFHRVFTIPCRGPATWVGAGYARRKALGQYFIEEGPWATSTR